MTAGFFYKVSRKRLTVSTKSRVLYWGVIRNTLKVYLKVLHFLKASEMCPRFACKSSILTLPLFVIYLLILLLVATSSFQQLCLMVDENILKALFLLRIPTLYGKQKQIHVRCGWKQEQEGGGYERKKEGRREGKKKGRKRRKGGMGGKMKTRKSKVFYNVDLTSSLSQTCFTEYVSLGAYNATTTEKPAWSDTAWAIQQPAKNTNSSQWQENQTVTAWEVRL